MRTFPPSYAYANTASEKYPRFIAAIIFETDSIYLTSHTGIASVPGIVIENVLREPSAVSIRVVPDEGRTEIGAVNFDALDVESALTDAFRTKLTAGAGLKGRKVLLYHGFAGADFTQYQLFQTQVIAEVTFERGVYAFTCADITREQRKDICEPKRTTLTASIAVGDTTVNVVTTAGFDVVAHGTSWSDAPSSTVGYFRVRDTMYRYTGKTDSTFTGVTQGVLNTRAVPQVVDVATPDDQKPKCEEFIYLELPVPKLILALLTGTLYGQGGAVLPEHWHLGIAAEWVRQSDFTGIGPDLWDPASDSTSFIARFAGLKKTAGKRFLEAELYQLIGCYPLVYADGTLGIRRMNRVLADAPAIRTLDASNISAFSALRYDMGGMSNSFRVDWNFDIDGKSTRATQFVDLDSIALHGATDVKKFSFKGLYGSRHTDGAVRACIDALRDRYTHPPALLTVSALPSQSDLEVGDIVRVRHDLIRDYVGDVEGIDRSFEIQRIRYSAAGGELELSLFGSTGEAGATATTGVGGEGPDDENSVPDDFYDTVGIELSTVIDITGSNPGVVDAGTYNLGGDPDMNDPAAIYYYLGDLEIPDGVTINITENVQLRVRGFLQLNGDISGVGGGIAGATDSAGYGTTQAGTRGALGVTRGMDGIGAIRLPRLHSFVTNPAITTQGQWSQLPYFTISVNDTPDIVGIPADLRGTSGGAGGKIYNSSTRTVDAAGGPGADGGSGLCIICRGMAIGVSGSIDLSGGDATTPTLFDWNLVGEDLDVYPGAGAPGCGGGLLLLLDGALISLPDLSGGRFLSSTGACGAPRVRTMTTASGGRNPWPSGTDGKEGFLDPNTTDSVNNANSAYRIQYLPAIVAAVEDQPSAVPPPTGLAATGVPNGILLTATLPPFDQFDSVEVWMATTNDRSGATQVNEMKSTSYTHALAPATTRYFWERNRRGDLYSTWEPAGATSGVSATSS